MTKITSQELVFGTEMGRHFDPESLAEDARHIESLGFDLLSVSDHLHTDNPRYEPWTAITWIAAATERLNVLTNVLALPYRHPAVLAKMADILDRLSDHRLILGLGGGGFDHEFAAFGLTERTPGQKLTALSEAITIIRSLWSEPGFTLEGEQFQVTEARIEPRPERPIPIWVGAYGPRSLRLTGAVADGWLPSFPRMTIDEAAGRRAAVIASALEAGRAPDAITCACNVVIHFASDQPCSPQLLTGSSQAVAEQLDAIVNTGFTCPIASFIDPAERDQFAAEVIPLVRHESGLRGS